MSNSILNEAKNESQAVNFKIFLFPFLVLYFWVLYLIWFHFNLIQMDVSGHISSARSFSEGLFHQYNDLYFLGYVHDLFYPPLEDALISMVKSILQLDWIVTFKIYLSILFAFYFFSIAQFNQIFRKKSTKVIFTLGSILLLNLDKSTVIEYQGLSISDALVTGLSNQLLAGSFLFLLLHSLAKKQSSIPNWFYLTVICLSHIVVGLVAVVVSVIFIFFSQSTKKIRFYDRILGLKSLAIAALLTCFYWMPFLTYRKVVPIGSIFGNYSFVLLGCFLVGAFFVRNSKARIFFFLAFSFYAPSVLFGLFENTAYEASIPAFHYYRFSIFSLWFFLIGWLFWFDEKKDSIRFDGWGFVYLFAFVVLMFFEVSLDRYALSSDMYTQTPNLSSNHLNSSPVSSQNLGRNWFLGKSRAIDFGEESFLNSNGIVTFSNKGLFWESHHSHTLLSSYLSSLAGEPTVLQNVTVKGLDCEAYKCLVESFARHYNITQITLRTDFKYEYMDNKKKSCLAEMVKSGTENFSWKGRPSQLVGMSEFDFFPKDSSRQQENQVIQSVSADMLTSFFDGDPEAFAKVFVDSAESCRRRKITNRVFAAKSQIAELALVERNSSEGPSKSPKMVRRESGRYEIDTNSDVPGIYWIKLSYLPGFKLISEQGLETKLFEAFPGILFRGKGRYQLVYERTDIMKVGYAISVLTLLFLFLLFAYRRWRGGKG